MRLLACLLIVLASLGASEERFVKRFDDAMDVLKRGAGRNIEEAANVAARILVEGGPASDGPIGGTLHALLEANGPVMRWDRLGDREFGSHAQVFYVLITFERGIAFARLVAAKTKADQTVIVAAVLAVDPVGVLPEVMLEPDGR
ncbi:MAG: hypothetical protein H0X45_03185 [Planctomycetes bacterium]|nr:hypothetical protein [Planctomycetota bacterium]